MAKRKLLPRPHGSGKYTVAGFRGHIVSVLRAASRWWPPKSECRKRARVGPNQFKCAGPCKKCVAGTYKVKGKIKKQAYVFVDHIDPVVDPNVGFISYDSFIERLFVETDKLQLLCKPCHDAKTASEKAIAVARVRKEKEDATT